MTMPNATPMPMPGADVAGAVPGAPGAPGQQVQAPAPGTPEHAAFQLVTAVSKGDFDSVEPYISTRATGQLKELRTKTLSDAKKQELKEKFGKLQPTSAKGIGGGKQFALRSGNTLFTFTVKKEGDDYKVTELISRELKR